MNSHKEEALQLIADNMFDLVSLTDPQGHFTYVGKSHEILGYDLEYLKGKYVMDFVHPEDFTTVIEAFQDFLQKQEAERWVQYRFCCQDGSYLWLETRGKVLKDDKGEIRELMFSSRDITQRKAAEKALSDSNNLLDSVFNSIQDGITVLNADLTIRETNHTLKKLYSVNGSVVGQKCHEVSRKRSEPCKVCPAIQALESKKACSAVVPLEQEGQQKGWLEIFAYPFIDQSTGKIDGVVEFVRNITEKKKLVEELRLKSMVLDQIQDRVNIADLDGIITYANHSELKALGYSQEELIGISLQTLKDDPGRNISPQEIMEKTLSQGAWRGEVIQKTEDGQQTIVDLRTQVVLDEQGNRIALAGICTDMTERKQAEEALKLAKQQAQAANEAKSRYLSHMNHEMRTPLNGFMGFMGLMETTRLNQEQQQYLHHMKRSADHMLSIVNNVLDHAKIEAGEMQLELQPFYLKEEMNAAMAPLVLLAKQQETDLHVTLTDNLPKKVVGDAQRLRQILLNLGGNAVKYTEKGQVHITLTCLETKGECHTLQLVVEDTGIGMTKETLVKLFQPFYQADDGSIPQSKGTGLGLAITRELVELMGGQIHVNSTLGKGTRVEVHLLLKKS